MNSTPAGATNGAARGPVIKRKKKPGDDPFFSGPKARLAPPKPNGLPIARSNGHLPIPQQSLRPSTPGSNRSASPSLPAALSIERVSGFSDPAVGSGGVPYTDYKLVTTKKDLLEGLRYHILQLTGEKTVDIRKSSEFEQPAHLHRRDPRAPPPVSLKEEVYEPKDGLNPAEREELGRRKEIRQKEREANLAQIAPSQGPSRKLNNFKKKTQQVFRPELTEQDKKRIQTSYEEKLPWHLEDFAGKHCFVGEHQTGAANSHAAFVFEPAVDSSTGKFRLIPLEKLYHFKQKRQQIKTMTIEEAEAMMKKSGSKPEWLVHLEEQGLREARREDEESKARKVFTGASKKNDTGREDLDFEQEFEDDEEGDLFEVKDEDTKLAENKIKDDQMTANFFDTKDVREYDEAEEREKRENAARKRNFKHIKKALERRERNYNHGSDSEYESSTDSEEERERIEQERINNLKKEEEEEAAESKKSGAPSSGGNTPSGRKEKHSGTASDREGGNKKRLKRPGSPNLSDASGTDTSTRKKLKSHHRPSTQPAAGIQRVGSPANVPSSSAPQTSSSGKSKHRRPGMAGSNAGSDSEGAMESDGGAMSDGGKARRLKLSMNSPTGGASPKSRAQSPAAAGQGISRPSSTAPAAPAALPTANEIRAALRNAGAEGISIANLLQTIAHPKDRKKEFVDLVRTLATYDKARGVVLLKE